MRGPSFVILLQDKDARTLSEFRIFLDHDRGRWTPPMMSSNEDIIGRPIFTKPVRGHTKLAATDEICTRRALRQS